MLIELTGCEPDGALMLAPVLVNRAHILLVFSVNATGGNIQMLRRVLMEGGLSLHTLNTTSEILERCRKAGVSPLTSAIMEGT